MRKIFFSLFITILISTVAPVGSASETGFGPLITADQLKKLISKNGPFILDIRGGSVKNGFIKGAISVDYGAFRGPSKSPGQLVTNDHLTKLFQKIGLEYDKPTVIVYQGKNETDFGAAARVYWTLKSAGIRKLAILNGGMKAWTIGANRTVVSVPTMPKPSEIVVTLSKKWLATRSDVLAVVKGEKQAKLLDARPEDFYRGRQKHSAAARPGTLPQSDFFAHSNWFASGAADLDVSSTQSLINTAGFNANDRVVSFCNTGHWAATNWFALSEIGGLDDVKLYPESMVGWSNANLPMVNTPGLLQNLIDKITR